ncbi:MAG: glycosyltransferase family 2 protein [Candidatus Omnitrophica bacterium]|nr:glycosyltransferase family 2 protein [Candidatus Omnitrophota bacterium]
MCDIILLVYDQPEYTRACIESILKDSEYPCRLIIVDNGSKELKTRQYLERVAAENPGRVRVLRNEQNQGYVGAVNQGFAATDKEFVCVLSNDTVAYPGWLSEMVRVAHSDPAIGVVNPLWELPKNFRGTRDDYAERVARSRAGRFIETDWCRGFCFLVKRAVLDKIKGLDESFAPAYYDDWDFSLRAIRAGFICVRALGAFVWHHKNVTYGLEYGAELNAKIAEKGKVFCARWGSPQRLLVVDSGGDPAAERPMGKFILGLMRDQNKVTLVRSGHSGAPRHTSLCVRSCPAGLVGLCALAVLLNNLRHGMLKRFDRIYCSGRTARFLKAFPFIANSYPVAELEAGLDDVEGLLEQSRRWSKKPCVKNRG